MQKAIFYIIILIILLVVAFAALCGGSVPEEGDSEERLTKS